ncbi:hypothetical protein CSKR_104438 [Clonorchis sinensis]|uniref:Uncharacterized protein n=2 Tax=Clonorchis sinensis TaxID=79923 RepID=A0A8T1MFR8_CLOSI|nr:hypothetical protein CSKR_104438 [Clonorchis sinensis]GAA56106.1 hypothetical protein CLF_109983 [Clonorchis sinensis]
MVPVHTSAACLLAVLSRNELFTRYLLNNNGRLLGPSVSVWYIDVELCVFKSLDVSS